MCTNTFSTAELFCGSEDKIHLFLQAFQIISIIQSRQDLEKEVKKKKKKKKKNQSYEKQFSQSLMHTKIKKQTTPSLVSIRSALLANKTCFHRILNSHDSRQR